MLSQERNGTMYMCPLFLTCASQPSPPATKLLGKVNTNAILIKFYCLENSADSLKGRVFEVSLADLNRDSSAEAWRKMKV